MERRIFLRTIPIGGAGLILLRVQKLIGDKSDDKVLNIGIDDRTYWSNLPFKIANPVLENICRNSLKAKIPHEKGNGYNTVAEKVSHLEAFGIISTIIANMKVVRRMI